jgi:sugar lactone lactonase YvrE
MLSGFIAVRGATAATSARLYRLAGTGEARHSGDGGPAAAASLAGPAGLAVDHHGNVLIAELRHSAIRRVESSSRTIATVAGNGTDGFSGDGGPAIDAQLNRPEGVAADRFGNIYIADSGNDRIRRIAADGTITTLAGGGREDPCRFDGAATAVRLKHPAGVVADTAGTVYFNDYGHDIVCAVTPDGRIRRAAGTGEPGYSGDGGEARQAMLNDVYGIGLDPGGNLYICDSLNFAIRKIAGGRIATVAAGLSGTPHPKGTIGANVPHGVDADEHGAIFIADTAAHRLIAVRGGQTRIVAGSGRPGTLAADGTPAHEADIEIHGVRLLPNGDAVFNDYRNNVVYHIADSRLSAGGSRLSACNGVAS